MAEWSVIAIPLVVVLAGAWMYRWVQEDAFINFRIISNLLAGHGPVFNVGERVEAYSDPLWLYLLAALHAFLPFVSLPWLSIVVGLILTAVGVVLAGRATQRLVVSRGADLVVPIGLIVFSVVAGVWEFCTSGLEMGMVFAWIGLSYWLLVRAELTREPRHASWCAFVSGLGPLVRPELLLMSVAFLGTLGLVIASPGWKGTTGPWRRFGVPALCALLLPVLYEAGRMAYFALLVSNTALAKSAGASWWSQGAYYLWNFVGPYRLWVPLLLGIPLVVPRLHRWWVRKDRLGVAVLVTPLVAGLLDTAYVAHVGGDYLHARLLLPAFFGLCVSLVIDSAQFRSPAIIAIAGICVWGVACGAFFRSGTSVIYLHETGNYHGITNERDVWIDITGVRHPITTSDYAVLTGGAAHYRAVADSVRPPRQVLLVAPFPAFINYVPRDEHPARSPLPFRVAVDISNIGVNGYVSGAAVYVFDTLSLANPVGAHTTVTAHGRPGHEKSVGPAWMIARFGLPGDTFPAPDPSQASVAAARAALACPPVASYLHAITARLTITQMVSNIVHSFGNTTMHFSPDPAIAERQLCGHP